MKNDKYVVYIYNVCNVLMHEKMKPFILLLTLACIVSCGSNRRTSSFLSHIDTLYQQNPAEAIHSIDSFMSCHNDMSQHNRMLLTLYRLRAQNSVGEPFASDSLARKVVEYFDDNGSVEEQMSAYYVLGSVYRDLDNSPEALADYQKAVALADTTDGNKNNAFLNRVYGQMGDVLLSQLAFNEAGVAYSMAVRFACKDKDTLGVLLSKEQIANVLYLQNRRDEACKLREWLHDEYLKNGFVREASKVLVPNVSTLLGRGKVEEVGRILRSYEEHSGDVDSLGNVVSGLEKYYNDKANYLLAKSDVSGALGYYRKGMRSTDDHEYREAFLRGLAQTYKKLGLSDSVAKYSELARRENDSAYVELSTLRMQQMQAAYNYSSKEKEALVAKSKEAEATTRLKTVVLSFLVLLSVLALLFLRERHKKSMERIRRMLQIQQLEAENESKRNNLLALEQGKKDLDILMSKQQSKINALIEEKKELVAKLQGKGRSSADSSDGTDDQNGSIISLLWHIVDKTPRAATRKEWNQLKLYIEEFYPQTFALKSVVSPFEFDVMILVRLGFKPSEIAVLTDSSLPNVSNARKRMHEKLTKSKGSAKDFDKYIKTLI